jgi:hypothetical protein
VRLIIAVLSAASLCAGTEPLLLQKPTPALAVVGGFRFRRFISLRRFFEPPVNFAHRHRKRGCGYVTESISPPTHSVLMLGYFCRKVLVCGVRQAEYSVTGTEPWGRLWYFPLDAHNFQAGPTKKQV